MVWWFLLFLFLAFLKRTSALNLKNLCFEATVMSIPIISPNHSSSPSIFPLRNRINAISKALLPPTCSCASCCVRSSEHFLWDESAVFRWGWWSDACVCMCLAACVRSALAANLRSTTPLDEGRKNWFTVRCRRMEMTVRDEEIWML